MTDFIEKHGVYYGSRLIEFIVNRRNRRTLAITVLPSGQVEVIAPEDSSVEVICDKVRKRASWIVKQQLWFKQFDPRTPQRQYLGGETHRYLGRRYRLKICAGSAKDSVKFNGGYFEIHSVESPSPEKVKTLLDNWYRQQSVRVCNGLFKTQIERLGITSPPRLMIRQMQTRWGSLSKGGILTLNTSLIQAPRECIEYVIIHELCHLEHHNHSPEFYKLLTARLPDWEKRKQKLEESLI